MRIGPGKQSGSCCARCGFDLAGLPSRHRCPECGLRYDPESRFFQFKAKAESERQLGYGFFLLVAIWLVAYKQPQLLRDPGLYKISIIILLLLVPDLYRIMLWKRHTVVAISLDEVCIEQPNAEPIFFSWNVIEKASYNRYRGTCVLLNKSSRIVWKLKSNMVGGRRNAKQCVAEINRVAKLAQAG